MTTTDESNAAQDALDRGNNGAAAQAFGDDCPTALQRDPIYLQVYIGGCVLYGLLVAVFLM